MVQDPGLCGPWWASVSEPDDVRSRSQRITLLVSPGVFRENAGFA
jgi:hypothetical protein